METVYNGWAGPQQAATYHQSGRKHVLPLGVAMAILLLTPALCQTIEENLQLRKGHQRANVKVGHWVVVADEINGNIYAAGQFLRLEKEELFILNARGKQRHVPLDVVGALYHSKTRRIGYYTTRGLLLGAKEGAIAGAILYILYPFLSSGSGIVGDILYPFLSSGIVGDTFGETLVKRAFYGALSGALGGGRYGASVGFLHDMLGRPRQVWYSIGPGEWKIVQPPSSNP